METTQTFLLMFLWWLVALGGMLPNGLGTKLRVPEILLNFLFTECRHKYSCISFLGKFTSAKKNMVDLGTT